MLAPIKLPPGIYDSGTAMQAAGRWHDASLVRFYEEQIRPVGGWRQLSIDPVAGAARAIVTWRDNGGVSWAAIGTHTGLYVMTISGGVTDITPTDFAAEHSTRADAANGGGYGTGLYGTGTYGLPRTEVSDVVPATIWSLDVWGERLIACCGPEGIIYEWLPGTAQAVPIANAPRARAIVVTAERIIMALGADGDPRLVRWCDQENNTDWNADEDDYAGRFRLATPGAIECGIRVDGGLLSLTSADVWAFEWLGKPFVYGRRSVSSGAGVISRAAAIGIDGRGFWMGERGFWAWDGAVRPLPCTLAGRVFGSLNRAQASKVTCFHNAGFGEVWWIYPSGGSTECDSYVAYSYREGHWSCGRLDRSAAAEGSPFPSPLMLGSDGHVYEHEVGFFHDGQRPFLRGGPITFPEGRVGYIQRIMPDQTTLDALEVEFETRFESMGEAYGHGLFALSSWTGTPGVAGRQIETTFRARDGIDWRLGVPKLEAKLGGTR